MFVLHERCLKQIGCGIWALSSHWLPLPIELNRRLCEILWLPMFIILHILFVFSLFFVTFFANMSFGMKINYFKTSKWSDIQQEQNENNSVSNFIQYFVLDKKKKIRIFVKTFVKMKVNHLRIVNSFKSHNWVKHCLSFQDLNIVSIYD